jgi:hypothetical protein
MMVGNVVRLATLTLCLSVANVAAQVGDNLAAQAEDNLKAWTVVPKGAAGLVVIIDAPVSTFRVFTPDKKFDETGKWFGGPFVRQFRVVPGRFRVDLIEPAVSAGVNAQEGSLTYVRFAPYRSDAGGAGARITTWAGPVSGDVTGSLAAAFSKGVPNVYSSPFIESPTKVLLVDTTPPWDPPPPPPKK